jgi:photosystem II stability/assembly factor-like uncharacterized protein
MHSSRVFRAIIYVAFAFGIFTTSTPGQNYDPDHLQSLKWRRLALPRGGPVFALAGVPGDSQVYLAASGPGGLWKTLDSGTSWSPIFDGQAVASVSSVAVADSDPQIIYVGTGDASDGPRGPSGSPGNGVYKSADGGRTWIHVGLDETRNISKIIIDPADPNIVFVAALGHAFGPNPDRGVFRSIDGGQTWDKVLFKDEASGAVDIAFDPKNSKTLLAALCQEIRSPGHFSSVGPGSGLYKSDDEGATWLELSGHGLPDGPLGRMAIAISGGDSSRAYAFVEVPSGGGLYRSSDAGDSWELVNSSLQPSASMDVRIVVNPKASDEIYLVSDGLFHSSDAGASLTPVPFGSRIAQGVWLDPSDPQRLAAGTSIGVEISNDAGKSWTATSRLSTEQINHVAIDSQFPYFVYGAQPDGAVLGLAHDASDTTLSPVGVYKMSAAAGAYVAADRTNSDLIYAGSYLGRLVRLDKRDAQVQDISPWPDATAGVPVANLKYRFDASAPLKISAEDSSTIYFAGQVLFKSVNAGMSWDVISPDLTHNDKSKQQEVANPTGSDAYDVISAVSESPAQRNLIWAGTDDGLIHITRDGGIHWVSVTPRELPPWSRVNTIEASWHDGGTAYVAVDAHEIGDTHPYIFRTHKFGAVWKQITNGIPENSPVHVVREDPEHGGLLFAGTETGVYVSFNDGERWRPLSLNMPAVPVHDLVIKGSDLIAATYGRGFWVLDDFSALRDFDKIPRVAVSYLFKPPPTFRTRDSVDDRSSTQNVIPNSANGAPLHGATIHYWLREPIAEGQPITLEILDSSGAVVAAFTGPPPAASSAGSAAVMAPNPQARLTTQIGLNRFSWDTRYQVLPGCAPTLSDSTAPLGALALPGEYKVRLTVSGEHHTQPLEIRRDPRSRASEEDLKKQFELESKIDDLSVKSDQELAELRDIRMRLSALTKQLEPPAEAAPAQQTPNPAQEPPVTSAPQAQSSPAPDAQAAAPTDQTPAPTQPSTEAPAPTPAQQPNDQNVSPAGQSNPATPPATPMPESAAAPPVSGATQQSNVAGQSTENATGPTPASPQPLPDETLHAILDNSNAVMNEIKQLEVVLQNRAATPQSTDEAPDAPNLRERLAHLQVAIDSADSAPTTQEYQLADELEKIINSSIEAWQGIQEGDLQGLNELLTTNGIDAVEADSNLTPVETH